MTALTEDQKDSLREAYMKMLEQFPESVEGDDIQEDSMTENEEEGAEVEVEMPKKGGALTMAFDRMRGMK
jgi:hypothetical protein